MLANDTSGTSALQLAVPSAQMPADSVATEAKEVFTMLGGKQFRCEPSKVSHLKCTLDDGHIMESHGCSDESLFQKAERGSLELVRSVIVQLNDGQYADSKCAKAQQQEYKAPSHEDEINRQYDNIPVSCEKESGTDHHKCGEVMALAELSDHWDKKCNSGCASIEQLQKVLQEKELKIETQSINSQLLESEVSALRDKVC